MNIKIHSIVTAALSLGLIVSTIASALGYGLAATATLIVFSGLVVVGLLHIAVLAYRPARYWRRVNPARGAASSHLTVLSVTGANASLRRAA